MGDFGGDSGVEERIFVSLRVRPFISQEIEKNDHSKWEIINNTTIIFKNSLQDRSVMLPYANTFDRVFGHNSDTRQVYEEGAKGVALSVLNGINSSIFAYGQTSSGKTYTMNGITKYTVEDIYDYIQQHEEREFILKFSAMEIYNEGVSDLLSSDSTPLRLLDDPERGTVVEKLIEVRLRDKSHLEELLAICEDQRQIGETSLNEASSRSHQIIRLTIESSARYFHDRDNSSSLAATVSFVDLAGSERASQTLSAGTKFKEGSHINRSLLTLGTVIRKLSKGRNAHVPYRDSKLTRILQNSLGGNARTAIICTMSPARIHDEQSRNTLLFASCAKEVTTRARVNLVMSDKALVKHLQREVARLQDELNYAGSAYRTSHLDDELKEKDAQIMKMEKEIRELIQQRYLAESRIQDLLSSLGDDQVSRQSVESSQISVQSASKNQAFRQWGESIQPSVAYQPVASEDESSISEASSICYQSTHQARMIIRSQSRSSEDQCKEVRCIQINDSKKRTNESSLLLDEICDSRLPITSEAKLKAYFEPRLEEDNGSLEWQNQVRMKQISDISTPRCLEKGRHENASTGSSSVSFGPEAEVLSGASQKLEEVPQPEDQKQLVHNQEIPQNPNENYKVEGIRREASTQTLLSCSESPSQRSSEFKKQKREIIELWDACNVSLIRRTYFFLHFKGEPTDSIYMEVEHRRLSFLKRMLSQGKETETATFSVKNLRRERAMLHRRIQRKLSTEERNHLYIKWGIKLHSKKRAMQLAKLLWTDTKNIECVEESALLVAKLIGILKPDLVLKEMFGLSFMPREWHRSSCAWKSMLYFR